MVIIPSCHVVARLGKADALERLRDRLGRRGQRDWAVAKWQKVGWASNLWTFNMKDVDKPWESGSQVG